MNDDITAIDFAELRKQEKIRAKRYRLQQQQQQQPRSPSSKLPTTEETKVVNDDANTYYNRNKNHPPSLKETFQNCSYVNNNNHNHSFKGVITCTINTIDKVDIHQYKIKSTLQNVYYIPKLLHDDYIKTLSQWLKGLPIISNNNHHHHHYHHNHEQQFHGKWTRLKHAQRNVALFDLKANISTTNKDGNNNNALPLPLHTLCQLLVQINVFPKSHPPNHVLINEYQPNEGILPHTDGPLYYHKTATFSIGGDVLFQFTERQQIHNPNLQQQQHQQQQQSIGPEPVMQIMLSGKGSLIVFDDDAYINHCHSINDRLGSVVSSCNVHDSSIYDNNNCNNILVVEYANKKCCNLDCGTLVERGHRYSITFRHKYNE